jgi:hypothetical protein
MVNALIVYNTINSDKKMNITQFRETLVDTILGLDNQGPQEFNKQELTANTYSKKQQKNVVETEKSERDVSTAIKVEQ